VGESLGEGLRGPLALKMTEIGSCARGLGEGLRGRFAVKTTKTGGEGLRGRLAVKATKIESCTWA
jgi:hypothetical protein